MGVNKCQALSSSVAILSLRLIFIYLAIFLEGAAGAGAGAGISFFLSSFLSFFLLKKTKYAATPLATERKI